MVRVHGFGLPEYGKGRGGGEVPVIGRTYFPSLGRWRKTRKEYLQGVVAFHESVAEEGAGAFSAVTVADFSVPEMEADVIFINGGYADETGSFGIETGQKGQGDEEKVFFYFG